MYYCSACKLKVIVVKLKAIKACTCEAPVVATMTASMAGKGGVKT